jgi:hypothetical protein
MHLVYPKIKRQEHPYSQNLALKLHMPFKLFCLLIACWETMPDKPARVRALWWLTLKMVAVMSN